MTGIREGRVVVVTGARRGLGREHALELARQVARVVVNEAPARVTELG
jgi:NAD(P)-dependent dehydrogenase (short-subunit alcohol dehydrogenase family)